MRKKKPPHPEEPAEGGSRRPLAGSADQRQITRRFLAAIAHDLVLDLLAFVEPRQAGPLDRRDMDEHVLAAGIRLDEAVTLLRIEPLDRTRSHVGLREIRKARRALCVPRCSCRPHGHLKNTPGRRDGKGPKQKLAGEKMGGFPAKRNRKSRLTQKFHTGAYVKSSGSGSA